MKPVVNRSQGSITAASVDQPSGVLSRGATCDEGPRTVEIAFLRPFAPARGGKCAKRQCDSWPCARNTGGSRIGTMTAERPRRGSASASPWAALPAGVKEGLARLVADNRDSVAAMLQAGQEETEQQLCGRCAGVIKQQQLSPGSFLARFFPAEVTTLLRQPLPTTTTGKPHHFPTSMTSCRGNVHST